MPSSRSLQWAINHPSRQSSARGVTTPTEGYRLRTAAGACAGCTYIRRMRMRAGYAAHALRMLYLYIRVRTLCVRGGLWRRACVLVAVPCAPWPWGWGCARSTASVHSRTAVYAVARRAARPAVRVLLYIIYNIAAAASRWQVAGWRGAAGGTCVRNISATHYTPPHHTPHAHADEPRGTQSARALLHQHVCMYASGAQRR
jgi:hypothetical protein